MPTASAIRTDDERDTDAPRIATHWTTSFVNVAHNDRTEHLGEESATVRARPIAGLARARSDGASHRDRRAATGRAGGAPVRRARSRPRDAAEVTGRDRDPRAPARSARRSGGRPSGSPAARAATPRRRRPATASAGRRRPRPAAAAPAAARAADARQAAAPPPPPPPPPPYVQAAARPPAASRTGRCPSSRSCPVWAVMYYNAVTGPAGRTTSLLAEGAEVYAGLPELPRRHRRRRHRRRS